MRSMNRRRIYITASILMILLGLLDCLIRQPFGLITWNEIKGISRTGRHGASTMPCGWDYEGHWQIGIVYGTNPSLLNRFSNENPVLTCGYITGIDASFVADPFLVILTNSTLTHQEKPSRKIRESLYKLSGDQNMHDKIRLEQVSNKWQQIKKKQTKVTSSLSILPSFALNSTLWYLFYELKNLQRYIGEIGVAISIDYGHSWKHLGVALSEKFHLSYPFVMFYPETQQYFMIPETHENQSIRIYTTTSLAFPFGWTLLHIPLMGAEYVDTSVIYYHQKYWIFTTIAYELFVYYTSDLLLPWTAHRKNPVVRYNRALGRSAGRVVFYDHYLWRYAQDCTYFYGEKVHVLRINLLTETEWNEELVNTIEPPKKNSWNIYRLHHIDAHEMMINLKEENIHKNGTSTVWLAMIDGDDTPYNYQFYIHEGWFIKLKRVMWYGVIIQLTIGIFLMFRACRILETHGLYLYNLFCIQVITFIIMIHNGLKYIIIYRQLLFRFSKHFIGQFLFILLLHIIINITFTVLLTCLYGYFSELRMMINSSLNHNLLINTNTTSNLNGFVIVTATSSLYFDRLRNLVGSIHVWEPGQRILVYDIGLTENELIEAQCWFHVEIRQFDFDLYPIHVKNLYNYAWKILIIEDALKYDENVLVLDAGAELRYSLRSIKEYLGKHGYWISTQPNIVVAKTSLQTFFKLDMKPEWFIGKEFCSGGLQGYTRDSPAYKNVLKRAVRCALDESCIAPLDSGRSIHNFDQSVISILMHYYGYRCEKDRKYKEMDMCRILKDERDSNDIVIGLRRWHIPKPYIKHIRKFEKCQKYTLQKKNYELIEHTVGSYLERNSLLVQCLRQYNNDRKSCAALVFKHQQYNERNRLGNAGIINKLRILEDYSSCHYTHITFISILIILLQIFLYRSGISTKSLIFTCFKSIRFIVILFVLEFFLISIYD